MYPMIGVRFLGFPKLQGGAETCLDRRPGAAGPLTARDVPLLIGALAVRRLGVSDQAQRALAKLAGQDLGPEPGPWRQWWAAERRARGLPEARAPKPQPALEVSPATALLARGWQIVLIQVFVVAAAIFLCTTLEPPMQVAMPACAVALLMVLVVPRFFDARRVRRRSGGRR